MHKYLVRHLANKSKLPDKLAGSGADRQTDCLKGWHKGWGDQPQQATA